MLHVLLPALLFAVSDLPPLTLGSIEVLPVRCAFVEADTSISYCHFEWRMVNKTEDTISGQWTVWSGKLPWSVFTLLPHESQLNIVCAQREDILKVVSGLTTDTLSFQPSAFISDTINAPFHGDAFLSQTYPNPFGGSTQYRFWTGSAGKAEFRTNIDPNWKGLKGDEFDADSYRKFIKNWVTEVEAAGLHSYVPQIENVPSGVYILQFWFEGRLAGQQKFVLVR